MQNLEFTTADRILAKLTRDLRGTDFNESDVIEWMGEALAFLKVFPLEEQSVAFLEVRNHEALMPTGLQTVLQVARNNDWVKGPEETCGCPSKVVEELSSTSSCETATETPSPISHNVITDCQGRILNEYEIAYYRPYFDLQYEYSNWTSSDHYKSNYTPVRLANNTLFNTLVSKERGRDYKSCVDEFTIVGTSEKKFRFSFKEGQVAVPYTRTAIDPETGYPLVPDHPSCLAAITYYIKWKLAEVMEWSGRANANNLADKSEARWLKYVKQAKSNLKMPKTIDQYQNLLEASHRLIPNHKRYYNFFGNLGRPENRQYFDPDNRNQTLSGNGYRGDTVINHGANG